MSPERIQDQPDQTPAGRRAPELTAILTVGPQRARGQRALNALLAQTALDRIEILVVDLRAHEHEPLAHPADAPVTWIRVDPSSTWAAGRCEGVRAAAAPVVAFIEDHCFPAPGWAEALIRAHREPWAVVGYAFTDDNPQTFTGRGSLVKDYGLWMHPMTGGPTRLMPGNNVSYKRDLLLAYGDQLPRLLTPDFSIQGLLAQAGHSMCIEPDAIAAHQNYERLKPSMQANFAYARLLAGRRAESQGWSSGRRALHALLTPAGAPVLGLLRLFKSLRGRETLLPRVLQALPVYVPSTSAAAWGEAIGYLFGEGDGERAHDYWELEFVRRPE